MRAVVSQSFRSSVVIVWGDKQVEGKTLGAQEAVALSCSVEGNEFKDCGVTWFPLIVPECKKMS